MSEKINDGGPAFPMPEQQFTGGMDGYYGMSLRDYFAAKAMLGMLTTAGAPCLNGLDGYEGVSAIAAYKIADAMLLARSS